MVVLLTEHWKVFFVEPKKNMEIRYHLLNKFVMFQCNSSVFLHSSSTVLQYCTFGNHVWSICRWLFSITIFQQQSSMMGAPVNSLNCKFFPVCGCCTALFKGWQPKNIRSFLSKTIPFLLNNLTEKLPPTKKKNNIHPRNLTYHKYPKLPFVFTGVAFSKPSFWGPPAVSFQGCTAYYYPRKRVELPF